MKDYVIFTDASADMPEGYAEEYDIHIVPMNLLLDDDSYTWSKTEGEDQIRRFYDAQRNGSLTHTSQVSPQQYVDSFSPVLATGRDVLCISLSGGLTNSQGSIHIAQDELAEIYPDVSIYAVDSLSASGGIGLLIQDAVENRKNGMSVQENKADLEDKSHRVCHLFMVEDLLFLKRGGRISAATAIIGTALSVKPILVIDDEGKLTVIDKKRGRKQAITELMGRCRTSRDLSRHDFSIIHADAPELASLLVEEVKMLDPEAQISVNMLTPIIGAHTGPGLAAVIYYGDRCKMIK
jgi:DegV family protein with EDD domain